MKKYLLIIITCICIITGCAGFQVKTDSSIDIEKILDALEESEVAKARAAIATIGGDTGAVDKFGIASLEDQDMVWGLVSRTLYFWEFHAGDTDSEDSTLYHVIRADDGAGTADAGSTATTMTDSAQAWTTNELNGLTIYNVTDTESCTITSNTNDDVVCSAGGMSWSENDDYVINGVWKLADSLSFGRSETPQWIFRDSNCTDSDPNLRIQGDCVTTATNAEDCELSFSAQIDGALTERIKMGSDITDDEAYEGWVYSFIVDSAETNFTFGQAYHVDTDGDLVAANATDTTDAPAICLALESGTGLKKCLMRGFITETAWTWTVGGIIYLGTAPGTTQGMTQTEPGSGDLIQELGIAISADTIYFHPTFKLEPGS